MSNIVPSLKALHAGLLAVLAHIAVAMWVTVSGSRSGLQNVSRGYAATSSTPYKLACGLAAAHIAELCGSLLLWPYMLACYSSKAVHAVMLRLWSSVDYPYK